MDGEGTHEVPSQVSTTGVDGCSRGKDLCLFCREVPRVGCPASGGWSHIHAHVVDINQLSELFNHLNEKIIKENKGGDA